MHKIKTFVDALGWLTRVLPRFFRAAQAAGRAVALAGVVGLSFKRKESQSLLGGGASSRGGCGARWPCGSGALAHSVPAQLAGAMATHADHVLQPVQAHWTHGLETDEPF